MKERINLLRSEIARHNQLYYVDDNPEISDRQFDAMFAKLVELETEYPEYADPNSPTQRVGSDLSNNFTKRKHPHPMLSIQTLFIIDEKAKKEMAKHEKPYFISAKYDGAAIELNYNAKGALVNALTRGNGYDGHDVTDNIRTIKSIPLNLKNDRGCAFTVRGEIFLTYAAFNTINRTRKKRGQPLYENIRNAAASLLKAKTPAQTSEAELSAVFFYYREHTEMATIVQIANLNHYGFQMPYVKVCSSLDDALFQAEKINAQKHPFPTDGAVIKSNVSGNTSNKRYQTGAWAIKTNSPVWETPLRFVSWNVSSQGKLTPVAHYDLFTDCGSTFAKASLISINNIKELNLREGATVQVQIAGFTTPQIIAANGGTKPIEVPTICPDCHQPLVDNRCVNTEWCPAFGFTADQVKFPHQVQIDLPRSPIDGPGIFKMACIDHNAIVVRTESNKHDYVLMADSLDTVAKIGVQFGLYSPGPFRFEKPSVKDLKQSLQQLRENEKRSFI